MNPSKSLFALLTALGVWLQRFPGLVIWCHRLCGIDRRILARAPKPEQAAYTALGALMILSACWTGLGMAYKLGESLNVPWPLRPLIFVFFMALGLCLEVAVLATVKPGIGVGFIVLRVKLGLMLVVMQLAPVAIVVFDGPIQALLHRERLVAVAQAGELSAKARNVASLEQGARTLDEKAEAARAAMADPQHPPQAVVQAAAAASAAEGQLSRANAAADAARRRHADARAALGALAGQRKLDEAERSRREAALNVALASAARRLAEAQLQVNAADVALQSARSEHEAAVAGWHRTLEEASASAAQRAASQAEAVAAARTQQGADTREAEALARQALKPSFGTALGALARLAGSDITVAVPLLFIFLVALTIDLTPLAVKVSLLQGVHALGLVRKAEAAIEAMETERQVQAQQALQARMAAEQALAASRQWAELDQGSSQAQLWALQAQAEIDRAELDAPIEAARQHLAALQALLAEMRAVQDAPRTAEQTMVVNGALQRLKAMLERMAPGPDAAMGAGAGAEA
ncbi:DUF4407 domain-containing protein [Leptothrix sp. BB-4]